MLLRLDPESDMPIYLQIARSISKQVEQDALAAGERLPSARTVAASLGVNMHTVLRAYTHLAEMGLVEVKRGRGGVVVRKPGDVETDISSLVRKARSRGLSRSDLLELVRGAWK